MARTAATFFLSLIAGLAFSAAHAAEGARSIVLLKDGVDPDAYAAAAGGRHGFAADHVYTHTLHGFAGHLSPAALAALAADPAVRKIETDRIISLPKPVLDQAVKGNSAPKPSQVTPTGIARIGGPSATSVGSSIAIVDTGIDLANADLDVSTSTDRQKNFVRPGTLANDDNGHGTHCAGIAAAKNNTTGVVGVAPGAKLYAAKVLDRRGSGWLSDIAAGIDWAVSKHVNVISMSLGGTGTSDLLAASVNSAVGAGVVVVVAAGNDNQDVSGFTPANIDLAITVGALADSDGAAGGTGGPTGYGSDDYYATFSNWGAGVDIVAPGVAILSLAPGGGTVKMSGTSMACPHVAGAAALWIAHNTAPTGLPSAAAFVDWVRQGLIDQAVAKGAPGGYTGGQTSAPLLNIAGFK